MTETRKYPTRGFGGMDKDRQRKLASMGGKAAHAYGTAHKWTRAEAKLAGEKGGRVTAAKRQDKALDAAVDTVQ